MKAVLYVNTPHPPLKLRVGMEDGDTFVGAYGEFVRRANENHELLAALDAAGFELFVGEVDQDETYISAEIEVASADALRAIVASMPYADGRVADLTEGEELLDTIDL